MRRKVNGRRQSMFEHLYEENIFSSFFGCKWKILHENKDNKNDDDFVDNCIHIYTYLCMMKEKRKAFFIFNFSILSFLCTMSIFELFSFILKSCLFWYWNRIESVVEMKAYFRLWMFPYFCCLILLSLLFWIQKLRFKIHNCHIQTFT